MERAEIFVFASKRTRKAAFRKLTTAQFVDLHHLPAESASDGEHHGPKALYGRQS